MSDATAIGAGLGLAVLILWAIWLLSGWEAQRWTTRHLADLDSAMDRERELLNQRSKSHADSMRAMRVSLRDFDARRRREQELAPRWFDCGEILGFENPDESAFGFCCLSPSEITSQVVA